MPAVTGIQLGYEEIVFSGMDTWIHAHSKTA
jgi:hypothetical protein